MCYTLKIYQSKYFNMRLFSKACIFHLLYIGNDQNKAFPFYLQDLLVVDLFFLSIYNCNTVHFNVKQSINQHNMGTLESISQLTCSPISVAKFGATCFILFRKYSAKLFLYSANEMTLPAKDSMLIRSIGDISMPKIKNI